MALYAPLPGVDVLDLADTLAEEIVDVYAGIEQRLTALIARRVAAGRGVETLSEQLTTIAALRKAAQVEVAGFNDHGPVAEDVIYTASEFGSRAAAQRLLLSRKLPRPTGMVGMTPATVDALAMISLDLTNSLDQMHNRILRAVSDDYQRIIADIAPDVISGVRTYQDAQRTAVDAFLKRGLTGFTDKRGRNWRIGTYAEMATRTATARAWQEGSLGRMSSVGVNLVTPVIGQGACEKCSAWAGKVLSIDGTPAGDIQVQHATRDELVTVHIDGTIEDARAAGLHHPNCGCVDVAYMPGLPPVADQTTFDPEANADRAKLRELERKKRTIKRQALGTTDEVTAQRYKRDLRAVDKEIRDHVDATGLNRQRHREQLGWADGPLRATPASAPPEPIITPAQARAREMTLADLKTTPDATLRNIPRLNPTTAQREVIEGYTMGASHFVNTNLRKEGAGLLREPLHPRAVTDRNNLDDVLRDSFTTRDLQLTRRIPQEVLAPLLKPGETLKDLMGRTIIDDGYMSTSLPGDAIPEADMFGDVELRILAPKGTQAAYISDFAYGGYDLQREVLLGRQNRLRVLGTSTKHGTPKIWVALEQLPGDFRSSAPVRPVRTETPRTETPRLVPATRKNVPELTDLNADGAKLIERYTVGDVSGLVNTTLRQQAAWDPTWGEYPGMSAGRGKDVPGLIEHLDRVLADKRIAAPVIVTRRVHPNTLPGNPRTDADFQALRGQTIHDPAYLSTSLPGEDIEVAHIFGTVELHITLPVGTRAAYIGKYSLFGDEQREVLVGRGNKMHVLSVTKRDDGITRVDVLLEQEGVPLPGGVPKVVPLDVADGVRSVDDVSKIRMNSPLNEEHVARLAAEMKAAGRFVGEPLQIEVMGNGTELLTDGHHRLAAARLAGITEVPVRVYAATPDGQMAATRAIVEAERLKETPLPPLPVDRFGLTNAPRLADIRKELNQTTTKAARNDVLVSRMAELYETRTFGRQGLELELEEAFSMTTGETVMLNVRDEYGDIVGKITRIFDLEAGIVTHQHLQLAPEFRGHGFSTDFSEFSEAYYRANGIKEIRIEAGLDDGGYVWAKAGYDWDPQSSVTAPTRLLEHIDDYLATNTGGTGLAQLAETRAKVAELEAAFKSKDRDRKAAAWAAMPKPHEIANGPGGKQILRNTNWFGKKVL